MRKNTLYPHLRQITCNLIALRNKSNLTQQTIANELGIERKTYAAMENGQTDIRLSTLIKLSAFYKVPLSAILRDKEEIIPMDLSDLRHLLENVIQKIEAINRSKLNP